MRGRLLFPLSKTDQGRPSVLFVGQAAAVHSLHNIYHINMFSCYSLWVDSFMLSVSRYFAHFNSGIGSTPAELNLNL